MTPNPFFDDALSLAQRGFRVFPVIPKSKKPWIKAWPEKATTDADTVMAWSRASPEANIGIATGAGSGIFVLDVDPRNGGDESLVALIQQNGPLPKTLTSHTGGNGVHYYYQHPGVKVAKSTGLLGRGLDVLGDGAYAIAPPSLHPNGQPYRWIHGDGDPLHAAIAAAPPWLLDLLIREGPATPGGRPKTYWRRLVIRGADEGERNTTIASLAGRFLACNVDAMRVHEAMQVWNKQKCRPPLRQEEVTCIVNSIAGCERRRRKGGSRA